MKFERTILAVVPLIFVISVAGCSNTPEAPEETAVTASTPPATQSAVPTEMPEPTLVPTPESATSSAELPLPYEDSTLNEMDYSVFFEEQRSPECTGEYTDDFCREKFGFVAPVPEGWTLEQIDLNGGSDGYTYFRLSNNTPEGTIEFGMLSSICDTKLFSFSFYADESGVMSAEFFFFYDDKTMESADKYDAAYVKKNYGGPLFFYKAYYVTQDTTRLNQKTIEDSTDHWYLLSLESFHEDENTSEAQRKGIEYLQNLQIVKLVGE